MQNIIVTIYRANNVNIGDTTTSDPYVILSSIIDPSIESSLLHFAATSSFPARRRSSANLSSTLPAELAKFFTFKTQSMQKSGVKYKTLDPVWDEQLILSSVYPQSKLVLTILDKDMVGSSDFLGQVHGMTY